MKIFAIDPGTTQSAWLVYDTETRKPIVWAKEVNAAIFMRIVEFVELDKLAIEMVGHYGTGMPAGKEVFFTCLWIGRYIQYWKDRGYPLEKDSVRLILRKSICAHMCGSARAKDPNIRRAIIDRYGIDEKEVIGRKKEPGPLYGMSGDAWSAMAVALTCAETDAAEGTEVTE